MHRLALRALPRALAPARHACRARVSFAVAARVRFYSDARPDAPSTPPQTTGLQNIAPPDSLVERDASAIDEHVEEGEELGEEELVFDIEDVPEKFRGPMESGDFSGLSEQEQQEFDDFIAAARSAAEERAALEEGEEEEMPEKFRHALETGDVSALSEEERQDLDAYMEAQRSYEDEGAELEEGEMPEKFRHALETGDFSGLSAEEQQELNDFLEAQEGVEDEIPEKFRHAMESGDFSGLSQEEQQELDDFMEAQRSGYEGEGAELEEGAEDGSGLSEEEILFRKLPKEMQKALETGDMSELSEEQAEALQQIVDDEATLPEEILDKLPPDICTAIEVGSELTLAQFETVLAVLEEEDYDIDELREAGPAVFSRKVSAEKMAELVPERVPVHWARALQSGDDSEIPEEELPFFERARELLYAKDARERLPDDSDLADPDKLFDELPEDVVEALDTGDPSNLSDQGRERLQAAADALMAAQLRKQQPVGQLDEFMKDATGPTLDPTGGAGSSMGPRKGKDDTFTTQEIKFLVEMKRLDAIDRAERPKPRWMEPPDHIKPEWRIPVAIVHFRSHELPLIELYIHFVTHAATALGIPCSKPAFLPRQRSMWTVPRSPFVHKKSQQNFHRITYKRAIKLWDANSEVVSFFVDYITRHTIGGVGVRIVRWDRAPIDVGQQVWLNAIKHPKSHQEQLAEASRRVQKVESKAAHRLVETWREQQDQRYKKKLKFKARQALLAADPAEAAKDKARRGIKALRAVKPSRTTKAPRTVKAPST